MKKFVSILILILSSFTYQVYAQENSDTRNYIVLTRNIEQMKPILLAAKNLAVEDGSSFGAFQVIICGKAVTDLTNPEKTKEFISLAEKYNVVIFACGFSLEKFNVDTSLLPSEFKTIENGIFYSLQLQKKGYFSVSL